MEDEDELPEYDEEYKVISTDREELEEEEKNKYKARWFYKWKLKIRKIFRGTH